MDDQVNNDEFSNGVVHHQSSYQDQSSKFQSATSSIDKEKVIDEKKSRKGSTLNSSQSKVPLIISL